MTSLIDVEALAAIIGDSNVVVLDASWFMSAEARDPDAEFESGHIPGAQRFDFDGKVKDHANDLPHMMPPASEFEAAVRALGVSDASRVVIYDTAGIFAAPRAWWMFRAMGHNATEVLDGGFPAWRAFGGAIETGPAKAPPLGALTARPDASRLSHTLAVMEAIGTSTVIVDARSAPRFEGRQPEPRVGLRSGHMPSARDLPFDGLIADGHFRSLDEMRKLWHEAGVVDGAPIITTCGSGVTAAILALSAEILGFGPVAVYDGSWAEWGQENRSDLNVLAGRH